MTDESHRIIGFFTVLEGQGVGTVFEIGEGESVVGRGETADIVVSGEGISRRHARLVRDATGAVTVVDLGSANGTFVNDERVQISALQDNDRVRVGKDVEFHFRYQRPDERDTLDLARSRSRARPVEASVAGTMRNLGQVHLGAGRYSQALISLKRALKTIERQPDHEPLVLAEVLSQIGDCYLGLDAAEDAVRPLQRSLDLLTQNGAGDFELAAVRFAMARALGDVDPARAGELATMARLALDETEAAHLTLIDRIEAWRRRR